MKTFVYVDGFNLYYRALKGKAIGRKWLNIHELVRRAMPADASIEKINYYTADISAIPDSDAPKRQREYLRALETVPCVAIHKGRFLVSRPMMYLDESLTFSPKPTQKQAPPPRFAKVVKTEEKGTDVNLGVHLVRDAFAGSFEQAVVVSNDTDLVEAIRIVVEDLNLPVFLVSAGGRQSATLNRLAAGVKFAKRHIKRCQFPAAIAVEDGEDIRKPDGW